MEDLNPRSLLPLTGKDPMDFPTLVDMCLTQVCQLLQVLLEKVSCGERAAFMSYAITYPHNFQRLVDTYCIMRTAILVEKDTKGFYISHSTGSQCCEDQQFPNSKI